MPLTRSVRSFGAGHLAPVFGFYEDGLEVGSEGGQGIHDEVMGSNVRAVPIGDMGDEDGCGGLLAQDIGDAPDHGCPEGGFLGAALGGDFFEAVRAGLD